MRLRRHVVDEHWGQLTDEEKDALLPGQRASEEAHRKHGWAVCNQCEGLLNDDGSCLVCDAPPTGRQEGKGG